MEERIIPLIVARDRNNEVVRFFFENKNRIEADISPLFPGSDEQLTFHFIYTGELQEHHKNNIRAWAMAHQGKNVTINIWDVRETAILEELDTAIKRKALERVEADFGPSESWYDSEKRKYEESIIKENDTLKINFHDYITSRDFETKQLKSEIKNLKYESIRKNIIDFLVGEEFFTKVNPIKVLNRRRKLSKIYDRKDILSFVNKLNIKFDKIKIEYKKIYASKPRSNKDDYIFNDFNHDIPSLEGYDLKTLFNFFLTRSFTPHSIANILAPIIVYKKGGVYLPMDCLPNINPEIWNNIKDLPKIPSTYSAQEIKEALRSERYDNPSMLLEDYNALKVVQSELIMEKLKKEYPDIFTSEDPIPTKPFPIERSDNPGLYSAFDYIKEREVDDMGWRYRFPRGAADRIRGSYVCVKKKKDLEKGR